MSVAPAAHDPEVELEQHELDRAVRALTAMRRRAEQLLGELRAAGKPDLDYEAALSRRIALLGESRRPLLFGRIDEVDGPRWRIGRRHVEEAGGDVLVVDWRAPVAVPFYRARPGSPLGLRRRRQILVESERVLAVADDLFETAGADASTTRLRGGDALLQELERARTGEMLDIVATIQAEQDEIIRGPLPGVVVVQGGPGTGKTAVGLHRAAFLLYNHPELARTGVLVLGPSRAFLRYIAQVLPSLGEEAVVQTTVADLAPRVRVRGVDTALAALTKGDARMATVLERALARQRRPLEEPLRLLVRHLAVTFPPEEVNRLAGSVAGRRTPYKAGRAAVRARLVALARQQLRRAGRFEAEDAWFEKELNADDRFVALLDRLWPAVSPAKLVSDLLSGRELLRSSAEGTLSEAEIDALLRPRAGTIAGTPWTADDLALLDEASFLLNGLARGYGHVVCDEAQDLSPMQLRMLARRATHGSVTLLGDLAQATGARSYQSWDEVLPHLPSTPEIRREELTLGYRAPAQILDLASQLLPLAAASVKPTSSVRPGRFAPERHQVEPGELATYSLSLGHELAADGALVGLVVPPGAIEAAVARAARGDERVGKLDQHGISRPITIVPAPLAKGLEFDAAVVVEPAEIAGDDVSGLRLLYVALTRPIQRLAMVHARPLPEPLADGVDETARQKIAVTRRSPRDHRRVVSDESRPGSCS